MKPVAQFVSSFTDRIILSLSSSVFFVEGESKPKPEKDSGADDYSGHQACRNAHRLRPHFRHRFENQTHDVFNKEFTGCQKSRGGLSISINVSPNSSTKHSETHSHSS
ncbi:hypothetical protein FOQG_05435 [Fusarium oxysporum f. sp. raphani 54005]|uniref:Uncharacterized protein n=1 Tax=Fusarium oxysporum f. sp. raphani 54005 TaxID=1089458 RepID=X0CPS3_FUSOX|nr:hypothetical protein FOQG_05435 [Fusarium oxysporum f. sp. raphani 54005]WKT49255.1 hypothetical protein QSH57_014185 [Fusarium oxysporum f. sp. vasinfectum]